MKRPFVILFIFLVLGMILQRFLDLSISPFKLLILYGILSLLTLLIQEGKWIGIAFITLILGIAVQQYVDQIPSRLPPSDQPYSRMTMRVLSSPRERNWYWEADVKILKVQKDGREYGVNQRSKLQIPKSVPIQDLKPGYLLEGRGVRLVSTLTEGPFTGYDAYLRSRGIFHIIRISSPDQLKAELPSRSSLKLFSGRIRSSIEDYITISLGEAQGNLLKSILLGNQGYLDEAMLSNFSKSGTAHIIAVSGLHIGILVMILERLLTFLSIGRNPRLLITLILITFYGFMVGLPISIVRAGMMYMLYVMAYFLHRRYDSVNSLMLIGFISVVSNPYALGTVSFQLSFGATLSILLFYPIMAKALKGLPKAIGGLMAVTLAAQLGTVPIILYHFQQISIISPLANLLIVPLLGLILTLALGSVTLGILVKPLGLWVNRLIHLLLTYINGMVQWLGSLRFSSITIEEISIVYLVLYYLILAVIYIILPQSRGYGWKEELQNNELSTAITGHRSQTN
ncbi:ComEC/Rec2 family competence protein [Alkaliphilus crotonatoxidans]